MQTVEQRLANLEQLMAHYFRLQASTIRRVNLCEQRLPGDAHWRQAMAQQAAEQEALLESIEGLLPSAFPPE